MLRLCFVLVLSVAVHGAPTFHEVHTVTHLKTDAFKPSGLAASHIHQGIFYSHDDSHGQHNTVFAIEPRTGTLKATLKIDSATNRDWESIAVGPCTSHRNWSCIYIVDTGKQSDDHHKYVIYQIREPDHIHDQHLQVLDQLHFSWHEGESECIMVDPSATVYVISMRDDREGRIMRLHPSTWSKDTFSAGNHLPHLDLHFHHHTDESRGPVGCDISSNGAEIILKSLDHVYYYPVHDGKSLEALRKVPEILPNRHHEKLGEGIAWTLNGDGYYTISEHDKPPIYFFQRISETTVRPKIDVTTDMTQEKSNMTDRTTSTASVHAHTQGPSFQPQIGACINESFNGTVGMAASRLHPGIFYMHFRSQGNRLVAINVNTGKVEAILTIDRATNTDWESLAVGPCSDRNHNSCIYIGDTGADGHTASNTVYKVREPTALENKDLVLMDKLTFSWPKREGRCMMVDRQANVYIVAMWNGGGDRYVQLTDEAWHRSHNIFHIHHLPHLHINHDVDPSRGPLGCDISSDGKEILVKTEDFLHYYNVTNGDIPLTLEKNNPIALPYCKDEDKGESVAWALDKDFYVTMPENTPGCSHIYKRRDNIINPTDHLSVHLSTCSKAGNVTSTAAGSQHLASTTSGSQHLASTTSGYQHLASTTSGSQHLASTTVGSHHLASTTSGSQHLASTTVGSQHLASTTSGSQHLASTTVGSQHLASTTIGSQHLASTTIASQHLASTTIGPQHLASTTIGSQHLASTTIGPQHLASTTIGSQHLASSTIGSQNLASTEFGSTQSMNKPFTTQSPNVVKIGSHRLDQVCGVASGVSHENTMFILTSNDTTSNILAINPQTGVLQATFQIDRPHNMDCGDISVGPCPQDRSCIYIAYTGNEGASATNTIYRIKEPEVLENSNLVLQEKLTYSWQETAPECLMADPKGNLFIMSGSRDQVSMGEIPAHAWGAWGGATIILRAAHHVVLNTPNRPTPNPPTKSSDVNQNQIDSFPVKCDLSSDGKGMLIKYKGRTMYYDMTDVDVFTAVVTQGKEVTSHEHPIDIALSRNGDSFFTLQGGNQLSVYVDKLTK